MFYGYSIGQWIGLVEYFCIVFALGAGVYYASAKATYLCFGKKNKKRRVRVKSNVKKKQVFFDVA